MHSLTWLMMGMLAPNNHATSFYCTLYINNLPKANLVLAVSAVLTLIASLHLKTEAFQATILCFCCKKLRLHPGVQHH